MKVIWTNVAKKHIEKIWDYIAVDSIFHADKFTGEIVTQTENLKDFCKMGRIVPELNQDNIREIIYSSYRIIYEIRKTEIYILQVVHGATNFNLYLG